MTLAATDDPATGAIELSRSRGYAFDADATGAVEGAAEALARYGFCVIDNVIPTDEVAAIRAEVDRAESTIASNMAAIRGWLAQHPGSAESVAATKAVLEAAPANIELRPVRRVGLPPKPPNDIVWLPQYARHLAHPTLVGTAKRVLDDHLKIAQLHLRPIAAGDGDTPGGFGRAQYRGRADTREWHTDWPHDLSAYGADRPLENAGCIRQPFPDVAMCLVMIWYLTDVEADSGATWVVPGSHRDGRNPRGPDDGITVTAPIPGDMQVTGKAGSVFLQDSRTWHASAMHNTSGRKRVAVVNRWCPWWLSVDDYAPGSVFNTVCRPLSQAEFRALPSDVQPFFRHVCPDEHDTLQQPVLDRAGAAARRNRYGYQQLETNPDSLATANQHIHVPIRD